MSFLVSTLRSSVLDAIRDIIEANTHLQLNKEKSKLLWSFLSSNLPESALCIVSMNPETLNDDWSEILDGSTVQQCFEQCASLIESGMRKGYWLSW